MSLETLESVFARFRELQVERVLCKRLAENDNSKQQVYLGGSYESLNLLPFGELVSSPGAKRPTLKAPVPLRWMDDEGRVAAAPGTQLILYPKYPEVRLSGFLRGCDTAPSEHMRPVEGAARRFNNGHDGRILLLGVTSAKDVIAFLVLPGTGMAAEFDAVVLDRRPEQRGVFLDLPLVTADARAQLIAKLREIHAAGWHASCRLDAGGERRSYVARNGAGYTLEALFGIIPNGRAEPDFLGWELKACGSDRVTLMTPEPDSGYYGEHGVEAFVRRYGREVSGDTLYFTGTHRVGAVCTTTHQTLTVRGFDAAASKITDADGGLYLVADDGTESAGWSFRRLLEHWGRKHASAAYVPYSVNEAPAEYRFDSPVLLGEGTDFSKFLAAMAAGLIVYDPAPKVTAASTTRPKTKARSQFRIRKGSLSRLYDRWDEQPLA